MPTSEQPDATAAAHALELAADARRRLATAVAPAPRWYAPCYGALMAVWVVAAGVLGAGHTIAAVVLLALYLLALSALERATVRTLGAWPRPDGPRVRRLAVTTGVLLLAGGVIAVVTAGSRPWLAGAVALVVGATAGVLSYRSDAAGAHDHEAEVHP